MTTYQSLLLGLRSSGAYFLSTFLFGVMFGIAASASGVENWQALLMSASVFSASAQFASLEFWQSPLPLGTIALSVFLVSSRNILLAMSMTHHFDGHSLGRRIIWLFILNDPGVVTSFRMDEWVDRLGYVTGYGIALMASWVLSTALGLSVAGLFDGADLSSLDFAGPLVMATMMMLFAKGSKSSPTPWIVSGIAALILFEVGTPNYLILMLSVVIGIAAAIIREKTRHV
ncbi:MAG: AzlC family ABC transporter permease [Gammaproteobacteria bacterium]|nr:AzlC family ABC transporter permease [Gammaproteobacteria bacterium]